MNILFCDLDGTIIFSKNFNKKHQISSIPLIPIELIEGENFSFISPNLLNNLVNFSISNFLVPSTTRTEEQFRRVLLNKNNIFFRYAITSNGANIIIDGVSDKDWHKSIQSKLKDYMSISESHNKLLQYNKTNQFIITVKDADNLFPYYIIDRDKLIPEIYENIRRFYIPKGYTLSLQGRKLYTIPNCIDKSIAMAELKNRIGDFTHTISCGDSLLDLNMLLNTDISIVPRHGELLTHIDNQENYKNIKITKESAYLASEEILDIIMQKSLF